MTDSDRRLSDRIAIVTGAANGIGAATARALADDGATLALVDVDTERLDAVTAELTARGVRARSFPADLALNGDAERVAQDVLEAFARIDILVNCAGVLTKQTTLEIDRETFARAYRVNLEAPLVLMQAAARSMIESGLSGRIVNVTSSSAHRAHSQATYSSAKAALEQLTRVAAAEWGPHDINVNSVAPGLTRTRMTTHRDYETAVREGPLANLLQRVSEPEDVAAVIAFLCGPGSRQITGQTIHTSAGAVV
jgi:NAD(P)-dependent dehydrogenase (short-subunit alcohol dehydrogenase family)